LNRSSGEAQEYVGGGAGQAYEVKPDRADVLVVGVHRHLLFVAGITALGFAPKSGFGARPQNASLCTET
jgi:hypothetical protein